VTTGDPNPEPLPPLHPAHRLDVLETVLRKFHGAAFADAETEIRKNIEADRIAGREVDYGDYYDRRTDTRTPAEIADDNGGTTGGAPG